MANIIIKTDERRADEARVLRDFGGGAGIERKEAAEAVAALCREAYCELKRSERK